MSDDHALPTPPDAAEAARLALPETRVELGPKVRGEAQFIADRPLPPGTLHAAFLGSPVPHARIVRVDTTAARAMPGVHAVITGEDVRGIHTGRRLFDRPVICWDTVRFVGDRLAAVAAETLEQAEAAVAAIEVELEDLPAILDPSDALADGAPILHPDAADYPYLDGTRKPVPHANVQGRVVVAHGEADLEPLFARAAHVVEATYTTPRQHAAALEARGTIVWFDPDGGCHVVTTHKTPFNLRRWMAESFGVPPASISVDATYIGGDFGGKGYPFDEYACYVLAKQTGRPVRAVPSYADELAATATRHAAVMRLRTACDADGRLLAHEATVLLDGGAYAAAKIMPSLIVSGAVATMSAYHVPNVRIVAQTVYTNTVPGTHVRSPGEVQALFAGESQLDELARRRGEDPLVFRLRNTVREGERGAAGEVYRRPMGREVLAAAAEAVGWHEERAANRGVGIALAARHVGGGKMALRLRIRPDGRLVIETGLAEHGAGTWTLVRRVFAVAASIPEDRIDVVSLPTNLTGFDAGIGGSRVTHMASRACLLLADAFAAWLDERLPAALPAAGASGSAVLRDGRFVDAVSGAELATLEVVLGRIVPPDEPATLNVQYEPVAHGPDEPGDYDFCAAAVEVAVDPDTGAVTLTRASVAADVGTVIEPIAHRGQIEGGFVFGLGGAMTEELTLDGGVVTNPSLADFKLPAAADVPPLTVVLFPGQDGPGAWGAKMAGEMVNIVVAPAVANAIADAVGARVRDLPLTSERVLAGIDAAAAVPS